MQVTSRKKHTGKFILLLCEIWCGLSFSNACEKFDSGEIEHIFPANPSEKINFPNDFIKPSYMGKLMNVCLLEAKFNKKIGNQMLAGKLLQYENSKFIMPHMLRDMLQKDINEDTLYYDNAHAEQYLEIIQEKLFAREENNAVCFMNMLDEVTADGSQNSVTP